MVSRSAHISHIVQLELGPFCARQQQICHRAPATDPSPLYNTFCGVTAAPTVSSNSMATHLPTRLNFEGCAAAGACACAAGAGVVGADVAGAGAVGAGAVCDVGTVCVPMSFSTHDTGRFIVSPAILKSLESLESLESPKRLAWGKTDLFSRQRSPHFTVYST